MQHTRAGTPYRLIDHTADFGIRVFGPDLPGLFANAAHAVFDLIAETDHPAGAESVEVAAAGDDWPDLMVDWLREVLYLWNGRELLLARTEIRILEPYRVAARLRADPYEPDRHRLKNEIKAVTYHGIAVGPAGNGWEARVILDV